MKQNKKITNRNANDNDNISAHVDCNKRIWSFKIRSVKPGICLAHAIVATNSLSTNSLNIQRFLYCDDDTDDIPLLFDDELFGLYKCRLALLIIGSGSHFINAAIIRLSISLHH